MENATIDLFEHYETLPQDMLNIIYKYGVLLESGEDCLYVLCKEMLKECEAIGYTFEYGLDGEPYELKKI